MMPTTTGESSTGRRNTARNADRPRSWAFSATARSTDPTTLSTTNAATYTSVFCRAPQNSASVEISR
jgi:hypothetical protein